jgi:uncharacterized SAM-binding protein YcdF (DUF218 family)
MTEERRASDPARVLFDYLYLRDPVLEPADAVIGFGHFDLKIPRRCLELHRRGLAPLIVFSGGRGAGTADLGQPEARAFLEELGARGGVDEGAVVFEDRSTHTGENVEATTRLLESVGRPLGTEEGVRSALIVANAYRQRRVDRTCRLHHPGVRWVNAPPATTFDEEVAMYESKGQDLVPLLCGEIQRLLDYPARGFCLATDIPPEVLAARERLESRRPAPSRA